MEQAVFFDSTKKKWIASFSVGNENIILGEYEDRGDAIVAYNQHAIETLGSDAKLIHLPDDYYFITVMQRPVAKSNMYKTRVIGKRAVLYTTRELEDFELMLGELAEKAIPETINTYASLYIRVYQKGRPIDIDNTFKAIQDSLDNTKHIKRGKKEIQVCKTGIANDRYFQLIIGERIHIGKDNQERIEILIEEYKGLFHFVDTIKRHYNLPDDYWIEALKQEETKRRKR